MHLDSFSHTVGLYFPSFCWFFFIFFTAGYEVAFIHPKSAAGVLVELVQAPADVIKALG